MSETSYSSDLLQRCKENIEVTLIQNLQNEANLFKQQKKDLEIKSKQLEIQNNDLKKIINVMTTDLEEQRSYNEHLRQENSKQSQIIKENLSIYNDFNEVKRENLKLVQDNQEKSKSWDLEKAEMMRKLEEYQNKVQEAERTIENHKSLLEKSQNAEKIKGENLESIKKKLATNLKKELKQKFRDKEEKLKKDISGSIEEIQKTIKNNSAEQIKLKQENCELQNVIKNLKNKRDSETEYESARKVNSFLKEKLEITESTLKNEIEKYIRLLKEGEIDLNTLKTQNSELRGKLSEKSSKIKELTRQLSEIEKKTEEIMEKFIEKESNYRKKLQKTKTKHSENTQKLTKSIEELQHLIKQKESDSQSQKDSIKQYKKDLDQAISDKKALEKSIADLEISLKQLDIQQARQSLQELASVKQKLAQEAGSKEEISEKIKELQQECEFIQKKIIQDSHFFKVENARKDQEILKLQNHLDSKLKQKEAEYAIKIEEIRADLSGVLEELINNEAPHDCCSVVEQIIEGLI